MDDNKALRQSSFLYEFKSQVIPDSFHERWQGIFRPDLTSISVSQGLWFFSKIHHEIEGPREPRLIYVDAPPAPHLSVGQCVCEFSHAHIAPS